MTEHCRICGRTYGDRGPLVLHMLQQHEPDLHAEERAEAHAAQDAEEEWLARYRCHLQGALGAAVPLAAYFFIVLLPAAAVGAVNWAFAALPAPGIVVVSVITYAIGYSRQAAKMGVKSSI